MSGDAILYQDFSALPVQPRPLAFPHFHLFMPDTEVLPMQLKVKNIFLHKRLTTYFQQERHVFPFFNKIFNET